MAAPTVFISYSHQDEAWKNKLLPQLRSLETAGVAMQVWQDRKIDGGDKWYPEILDAMASAAAAILLISPDFLASQFCVQEEVPALLKRQEEKGMLLIPVLLRPCVWKAHRWLKDRQMIPRDGKCVAIDFAGVLTDGVFAAVAEQVFDHFQSLAARPDATVVASESIQLLATVRAFAAVPDVIPPIRVVPWPALPVRHLDLTRLPETGSALFGRDEELALLDEVWESQEQAGGTPVRILALTAHGGVGKSTLVNHWLEEMKRFNYRGATRVFGWSFYSQGVREEVTASADSFIDAALRFFGDSDPAAGSPWDKGERLARLMGRERALLVLDGMEPLQAAHAFERGKLRDPALETLLRNLARQSAGLCVITTRESLTDLAGRPGVTTRDLEQINARAGRALLRAARVIGTDAELEDLAKRFGPHALALSLLGVYLREQPGHGIGPAEALEQLPGEKPIDRVLAGFEQWLGDGPEREALRLLGLFDRPADAGCLSALRSLPSIPGFTDRLTGLNDSEWDRVVARLEKLQLVHTQPGKAGERSVDAHPLIREHFAEMQKDGEAWRAGHRRLFEHLCKTTREGDQPTLEELQPLYQAVVHGCHAGMHLEARAKVLGNRIQRENEYYSLKKLGAFGADAGALACFFDKPWKRVASDLPLVEQLLVLSQASFCLRCLGRLTEALEPIRIGLEYHIKQENWKVAAIDSGNLSEINLALGSVAGAVGDAERSVAYADRSGDAAQRIMKRATHANALHYAARGVEAEARFREAESMQAEEQPNNPLLYSVRGFQFCDLLLAAAEGAAWRLTVHSFIDPDSLSSVESCRAVSKRAGRTLKIAESNGWLHDIALDHLTLARLGGFDRGFKNLQS